MMRKISQIYKYVVLALAFTLCSGCSGSFQPGVSSTPISQTWVLITETYVNGLPTNTLTPSKTTNPTTKTPEPTLTIKPPTKTPYPTLSSEKAKQLIDDAQKTNLGCELPCFWGVTPGKTSWGDTQAFFSALNAKIEYWHPHYSITIFYPGSQKAELGLEIFLSKDGIVESINAPTSYSISELLGKYGQPEQVWFYSGGVSAYSLPPSFSLAILYPEYGLLFYYELGDGEYFRDGITSIKICAKHLSSATYPRLYLWNSNTPKTFEQIKNYLFDSPEDWRFRPLEDVTNLDVPAFTKAFSSPKSNTCFLSPADIWPFPLK